MRSARSGCRSDRRPGRSARAPRCSLSLGSRLVVVAAAVSAARPSVLAGGGDGDGRGRGSRASSDWPSAATSVQPVSPSSQVWITGKTRVSPSASSGSCRESSKASRKPSGRLVGRVGDGADPLGELVAMGVGDRRVELHRLLGDVVVLVEGGRHGDDALGHLDADPGRGRAVAAVADAEREHDVGTGRGVGRGDGHVRGGGGGEAEGEDRAAPPARPRRERVRREDMDVPSLVGLGDGERAGPTVSTTVRERVPLGPERGVGADEAISGARRRDGARPAQRRHRRPAAATR